MKDVKLFLHVCPVFEVVMNKYQGKNLDRPFSYKCINEKDEKAVKCKYLYPLNVGWGEPKIVGYSCVSNLLSKSKHYRDSLRLVNFTDINKKKDDSNVRILVKASELSVGDIVNVLFNNASDKMFVCDGRAVEVNFVNDFIVADMFEDVDGCLCIILEDYISNPMEYVFGESCTTGK